MEPLETLQSLNLAVKTLAEIESLAIDDEVKNELTNKVLLAIGIEKPKHKKRVSGTQDKVLQSLQNLGGSAGRA